MEKRISIRKRLGWGVGILFVTVLVVCGAGCSALRFWDKPARPASVAVKVQSDVVYGRAGGEDLKLDVYFPTNAPGRRLPVVMYVHGGGWVMGSKAMLSMMPGPTELLRRGYLVVAIDYRLAPQSKFPAMIEDAKCAVRFLRAHADDFRLDPKRIGVMGDSAGGHLVALLGLTDASDGFEGDGWNDQSSAVQAVVDLYGPTDFADGKTNYVTIKLVQEAFGATNAADPVLVRASPVTYITGHAPPFLILHGDHDGLVDIKQSEELNLRLQAAGDISTFVVITNFAHGYTPWGLTTIPDDQELARMIADFFDRYLK